MATWDIVMYVIWSVIFILAIVLEINTNAQIGYAASAASIGAIIAHSITAGKPIWIELVTFFVAWAIFWIMFFAFYKIFWKRYHDKDDGYLAYIGKTVKAVEGNSDEYGQLKFSSKVFRFVCNENVKKDDLIIIKKIKGVTFYVDKVTSKEK